MERRSIAIRGTVQGVGFRPFVYRLAGEVGLSGFVKNQSGAVCIEVEGDAVLLDRFLAELVASKPPLAVIDNLSWKKIPVRGEMGFAILGSDSVVATPIIITPDIATCDDCLAEIFDPGNRRYRYPFTNCTNCGPRLTIVTGAPYDRISTTMAGFPLCAACRAEYDNPLKRRFHAQPIACASCGPQLALRTPHGDPIASPDPLAAFAAAIAQGKIGALKGLGGYHLVCDATNPAAVSTLRLRKHRDEKPFALMVRDVAAAHTLCQISQQEEQLLASPPHPIVLLRRRTSPLNNVASDVAPNNPSLGLMLPYTPLHHLLLAIIATPIVMTSGNRSDEPLAHREPQVFESLANIADIFLTHNRPIHVPCDDSVIRITNGSPSPIRRARGYAPQPISLPFACPVPLLAVGGQLKSTFALATESHAILSHHLGDLDHLAAATNFERNIALFEKLFSLMPAYIVHDLHPDYASTRYAARRFPSAPLLAVQHHHAHMASCMAEHQLTERVIGVTFDGTGLGTDNTIWGGEFLVGDYNTFIRAAHLRQVAMPGGEAAIKEPWRMAAAHLLDAQVSSPIFEASNFGAPRKTIAQMIERRFNSPLTSSAGRLFDAVAALAGIRNKVEYEGQAAMELETLAATMPQDAPYPFDLIDTRTPNSEGNPLVIDTRPIIRAITGDQKENLPAAKIARRFHSTVVEIISVTCEKIRSLHRINTIVFSGGVFMNALLSSEAAARLTAEGFKVHQHRIVPPNDGGISLGQIAIAAARLSARS